MLTLADILASFSDERVAGQLPPGFSKNQVHEVVIDSRLAMRGDVFVALPGERVDGHYFVGHALGRGAIAAIIHQDIPGENLPDAIWVDARQASGAAFEADIHYIEGMPLIIRVDNTLSALQHLAASWRAKFAPHLRVIGITGSVGKTTTKELTAQVLSIRHSVLKSEGNLNNEIGVPLTLLKLRAEHEYAVIEMGMYQLGEIALFASLAKPQVGVITMIAPVHLQRLGSMGNITSAKSELIQALPEDGVAILNDDDERVRQMATVSKARVVTYGLTSRADIWADEIESYGLVGISFTAHQGAQAFPMRVPLLGRHSVHTALRAAAVARVEGMAWEEILEGFLTPSPQLRLSVAIGPYSSMILDDTYNSSEESCIAALNLLDEVNGGLHIAVLGDMLELGDAEEQAHRNVGCRAALVARDLVCVGQRAKWMVEEAVACGAAPEHVYQASDNSAALAVLREIVREKSVILVKGSRGMKMEEIVSGLAEMAGLP
jgi:UDP-N-acetylmuramoyl-tripeptide--D-alanyl-D-alanine ligase